MTFQSRCVGLVCMLMAMLFVTSPRAEAVVVASDDASDIVYDNGWQPGDNGGFGFFGWTLGSTGGGAGHFVFTSTQNGFNNDANADGDIDTAGRAWGMFGNGGNVADAFRGFDAPLQVGDTFSFSMDIGFIDQGGGQTVGAALRTFGGDNRMELLFIGGDNQFRISDSSFDPTGVGFTDQGIDVAVTLTSLDTYDLMITELSSGITTELLNRTFASSGDITNFRGFNANAGNGASNNLYFNSLAINRPSIPEPASALLTLLGLGAMGRRRRAA